jgi:hypothetical protein
LIGELPAHLTDHHFGSTLRSYLLYQNHHCQVTQPLLREWGIDISSGTIDALLSANQDAFRAEKDGLLNTALATARYVTVDDSGARHRGQNGIVTHIANADFAWFASTGSGHPTDQSGHGAYYPKWIARGIARTARAFVDGFRLALTPWGDETAVSPTCALFCLCDHLAFDRYSNDLGYRFAVPPESEAFRSSDICHSLWVETGEACSSGPTYTGVYDTRGAAFQQLFSQLLR